MVTRIQGTNSGLDIDSLVASLMKAEKAPENVMLQKKQTLSWKMDSYREVNTKLSSFRDLLSGMRYSSNWGQTKVSSSDPTKVSITTDSTASNIAHTISVTSLAKGAIKSSSPGVSKEGLSGSADLSGGSTITSGSNDSFNVTLNGVTKNIVLTASPSAYSLASLQTEVQAKLDQSFGANQISVSTNGNFLQLTPNGTAGYLPQIVLGAVSGNNGLSNLGFSDKQSYKININDQLSNVVNQFVTTPLTYGDFTVNGQDITYSATDTISSIMGKVNNSAAGVNMTYDSVTDKFSFVSKGTGATAQVSLANGSSGNFITAINVDTTPVVGTDANVTIDGITSSRSSNNFTVSGVTYNLIASTIDPITATNTPVTVTVTQDTDSMVNKIKDFVSQYNDMVGLVSQKLNEAKYNGFPPLTADQKTSMKDADITAWETKSKSGLLKNDDILANISSSLRSMLSSKVQSVSSSFNTLNAIGITTNQYNSSAPNDAGKITLDENKLRTALAQDPSSVIGLFTNQDTSVIVKGVQQPTSNQGIAQGMFNRINITLTRLLNRAGGVNSIANDAGTDIGLQLRNLDTKISDFDGKLSKKEEYYYKQFSMMDTAIGNSNAQIAALAKLG
ncbi:MAG: Flagellar hook-associated protein 2 [Bacilli bacterium]|nr:Flagellar hook-associated protein 2 [Bacilli bacterium]